ncbi:MAG TPA: hypothetical protein PLZ86_04050, partial [bacterium]|nr:hypothetical protein [bacterium]
MSNTYKRSMAVAALVVASLFSLPAGAADLSSALAHPGIDPKRTSIYAAEATTGKELASHLPDLKLNP